MANMHNFKPHARRRVGEMPKRDLVWDSISDQVNAEYCETGAVDKVTVEALCAQHPEYADDLRCHVEFLLAPEPTEEELAAIPPLTEAEEQRWQWLIRDMIDQALEHKRRVDVARKRAPN